MASKFMQYVVYEPLVLGDGSEREYQDERPLSAHGGDCQQQQEDFYTASLHPCSYHIEDIQHMAADELKPIIAANHSKSPIPDFLISQSSSPGILTSTTAYDTWGNADDIPTRVPSAALDDEEFPPLMRCRNNPAMGWFPDDFIADIDYYDADDDDEDDDNSLYDDSVVLEWSSFLLSADNNGDKFGTKLFCCQQERSKDDETWSVISQSQASSTALPLPLSRSCTYSSNLRAKVQSDWSEMGHVPAPMPVP